MEDKDLWKAPHGGWIDLKYWMLGILIGFFCVLILGISWLITSNAKIFPAFLQIWHLLAFYIFIAGLFVDRMYDDFDAKFRSGMMLCMIIEVALVWTLIQR